MFEDFQGSDSTPLLAKQFWLHLFDADDDAPFAKAVEAMDLARAGGAATIAVLTEPIAKPSEAR